MSVVETCGHPFGPAAKEMLVTSNRRPAVNSLPFSHAHEIAHPLEEREEVVVAAGELNLDRLGGERVRRTGQVVGRRGRARGLDLVEADARVLGEAGSAARITSGVSSWVGIAFARLKTLAERTAGRACVERRRAIAVDLLLHGGRLLLQVARPVERFGEIRAK